MRVHMITRTVKTTTAKVMVVNTENGSTAVKDYELPRTYKDTKAVLRALEGHNTDTEKLVHVVDVTVNERLYGMPESDFIKYGQVIEKPAASTEHTPNEAATEATVSADTVEG